MRKLFGTDGIRGKANQYPMDAKTAIRVGAAIGHYFQQKNERPQILIGRDTRLSGSMIEAALVSGLCAVGCQVKPLGVISTPGVAHLTRSSHAEAGVVISASHNPFVDNGIKIFSTDGFKLPDDTELQIEQLILDTEVSDLYVAPHKVGQVVETDDGWREYAESLTSTMEGRRLDKLRIVLDCANGAAYQIAPYAFELLGATVFPIGIAPDGLNINRACGSLHIEKLQQAVSKNKADLGVAFDGDADRAIFVDADSREVDGDQIMAICAKRFKEEGCLAHDTLVTTVMSNLGLDHAMADAGVSVIKTAVGDRYVVEEMRAKGYNFGGEQSGHLIFLKHSTSGDGVLTALQVIKIMVDTGKPLSELGTVMARLPQVLKNMLVTYKRPIEELDTALACIRSVEEKLGSRGRVLVRYSGTEQKVRVMVEGEDEKDIDRYVDDILSALDSELN